MLDKVLEVAHNIKDSNTSARDLVPLDVIECFDKNDKVLLGKLVLQITHRKISFDFEVKDIWNAVDALTAVKESTTEGEDLYYTLKFISLFHRVTQPSIRKLLDDLV